MNTDNSNRTHNRTHDSTPIGSPVATPVLPLRAGTWILDPHHSSVSFAVRHLGVSSIRGRFAEFTTTLTVGETLDDVSLVASIDMGSIDTGNRDRDSHLCSPELIDVARRPTMEFASMRVTGDLTGWSVAGRLSFGDVVCPMSLQVEFGGIESYFDGTRHAGFSAVGEVRRSHLGIRVPHVGDAMLGDVVHLQLDVQLIEPA